MSVITRFPPSPTGSLHIGGARTALFNWLYTKKLEGKMVLRIEDTDRARSTQEAVDIIIDGINWLGLDWDEGPYYQTQRFDRYAEIIQQLLDHGQAYYCSCSKQRLDQIREAQMQSGQKPRYDQRCRDLGLPKDTPDGVIRFRNPNGGTVVFDDLVRGHIAVANAELDDLIIARADGTPTYNLTVVVDDMDMNMTHVLRGDDHINNTPRQINLIKALGAKPPLYAHVPMILGEDGKRLSKRHHAVSVLDYDKMGVLPHALLNYLVRLGWSHGDQEIFSLQEMIDLFEIPDINKAPSTFSLDKLLWLNQHYIKEANPQDLVDNLSKRLIARELNPNNGPAVSDTIKMLQERAQTMEEMANQCGYLYSDVIEYDDNAAKKHLRLVAKEPLVDCLGRLSVLTEWSTENIDAALKATLEAFDLKLPKLALPLRVAVAGTVATPSIYLTLKMVGQHRTVARINQAISYINARATAA